MVETSSPPRPVLSIIIPVWGDDSILFQWLSEPILRTPATEWIVAAVQPGQKLRTQADHGHLRLVDCEKPSRGRQMNQGAALARGDLLCFHHADSHLTPDHLNALRLIATDVEVIGGAFHRQFDDRHAWMKKWEALIHRLDRGYGPFFGDQSIFVRRKIFERLGGFADIPLMEDLEFSGRLKKTGKVRLLHPPIRSSPRRFHQLGNCRTTALNILLIALYYLGVSPHRLHQWYYRGRYRHAAARQTPPNQLATE